MPLRAFFVLERFAGIDGNGSGVVTRRNALTGIFCFGTYYAPPVWKIGGGLCRNALTGIFCFGTHPVCALVLRAGPVSQCPYGHFLFWNQA